MIRAAAALLLVLLCVVSSAPAAGPYVSAGRYFSFGVKADGTVYSWGQNSNGELCSSVRGSSSTPGPGCGAESVRNAGGFVTIKAGIEHAMGLTADGRVSVWGANHYGQLGYCNIPPLFVLTDVVAIAAGDFHNLAVKRDGTVWAWGYNTAGQLGTGNRTDACTPQQVPGLTGVVAVAAGGLHSLAARNDGTVWAWGENRYGQLGLGHTRGEGPSEFSTDWRQPQRVPGLSGIVSLAAGQYHSLAVQRVPGASFGDRDSFNLFAWGRNLYGEVGDGSTTLRNAPVPIPAVWRNVNEPGRSHCNGVISTCEIAGISAAGSVSTLAVTDGSAWAWGRGATGAVTGGGNRTSPAVILGQEAAGIATGGEHTLVLKRDGSVWATGWNNYGQLGNGNTSNQTSLVRALGPGGQGFLDLGPSAQSGGVGGGSTGGGSASGGGAGGGAAAAGPVSVSPASVSVAPGGGSNSVVVSAPPTTTWTVQTSGVWIGLNSPSSGTGNGSVTFTATANSGGVSRTGVVQVGDQGAAVIQPPVQSPPVQIVAYGMVKAKPESCSDAMASPPAMFPVLAPTEPQAIFYFLLRNLNVGDVVATEYYNPSGQLNQDLSGPFDPATSPNMCFADVPMRFSGSALGSQTGFWRIRVTRNGQPLLEHAFALVAAGTGLTTAAGGGGTGTGGSGGAVIEGVWSVNFNNFTGTMEITPSGGGWTGRLNLHGSWEDLTNITFNASTGAVSFTRPSVPQHYTGTLSGSQMSGTFTSLGSSYQWTATRTGAGSGGSGGGSTGGGSAGGASGASTGNLLQNPGAEAGPEGCGGQANLPGWTGNGSVGVCRYGPDVPVNSPGPPDRGNHYFSGGNSALATASQTVNLASYASQIDAGSQGYTLSGWLGGWSTQDDNARVKVEFKSASGATLGSAEIGPVLQAERGGVSGLIFKSASGTVPSGARSAVVTLTMTRTAGTANDGYADNLSFVLGAGGGGGTGGGQGSSGPNVTSIYLEGGSYTTSFAGNGSIWDTEPNSYYAIGVTAPGLNNPFLNGAATRVNLPRGAYWFYLEPGAIGSAMRLTVTYADGSRETAVFASRDLGIAGPWTRLTGSTNLTLGGTGHTNLNRNTGGEALAPGGATDFVLEAGLGGTAAGGGGGGTGGGGTGGGDGSIVTPGCNYLIQPLSITGVPGTGGVSVIRITTALNCSWGAGTTANWITFRTPASGTGNGVVEIAVAANPSTTSPRIGIVTVAGQQVSVSQNPAPACTYSISPVSASASAGGGPGSVTVTATGSGCTWSATSNAGWIIVASTTSTTVNYVVQANAAASPRTGTITIAGLTFTVNQAAGGTVPVISTGGIVNAASYAPGANGLARGSFVSIFGENIGPAQFLQASYPLPTTLGDVRVTFAQGARSVDAYVVFASSSQINAIIPSSAPLGNVNVTVTYRGLTSAPAPVVISDPSLGLFFQRQGGRDIGIMQNVYSPTYYPLNTPSQPAERGMVVVAWATGLGSSGLAENTAPGALDMRGRMPVEVRVDGIAVEPMYAGTSPEFAGSNNVYFIIPQEARLGCYIPVQISAGGRQANTVLIAISSDRNTPCTP